MLIALPLVHNLVTHKIDVKIAFLNRELENEIYMDQLQGYIVAREAQKLCRLVKSLYGLKQAPKK